MPGSDTVNSLASFLARKTTLYLNSRSGGVELRGYSLELPGERSVALAALRRLVLVGRANAPPALLYALLKAGVGVDWLDVFGHPIGLLVPLDQNVDASLVAQTAFCQSGDTLSLARQLILAKVDNCHEVLRRRASATEAMLQTRRQIAFAANFASLRGLEGEAARRYFQSWRGILHKFDWHGRVPRPAPDPVNLLLSTGYGLLRNRLASALRHAGLNPRLGFFHETRGRHAALASDLMEPLRALVDARVLTMLRRQEIQPDALAVRGGRCICADRATFALIMEEFERMFCAIRKFYVDPGDNREWLERSLNDLLDDLAESFAVHVHDGHGCLVPRLAPCAAV